MTSCFASSIPATSEKLEHRKQDYTMQEHPYKDIATTLHMSVWKLRTNHMLPVVVTNVKVQSRQQITAHIKYDQLIVK